MDQIKSMLDRLSDLTDGEIAELEGLILSEFEAVEKEDPTTTTVDAMTSLADALDAVRGETTRRTEQQAELTKRAAEAASRIKGESETAMMEKDPEENPVEDATESPEDEAAEPPSEESPMPEEAPAEPETPAEEVAPEEEADPTKKKPVFSEDTPEETELASETPEGTELSAEELAQKNDAEASTELSTDENDVSATLASAEATTTHTEQQEDAVTASGIEPQDEGVVVTPPADHLPTPQSGTTLTITAGADIPGYSAGSVLGNMDDVAAAFAKRLHTLRGVTAAGSGEQYTVATLNFDYPEDRKLSGDDAGNWKKINDVTSLDAITAAAGVCAPLTTVYDVNTVGITDRPVRDALARFNADRGGVRLFGTPTLDADSVGIWDTSGAATKTCGDADCPSPVEVMVDAVYMCLKFSNFTNRFFPEVVKANTDLALVAHAKLAEINLLQGIQNGSTKVTAASTGAGAARDLLLIIVQAAVNLRGRHRLSPSQPLRALIPSYARDVMRADLALQAPGDGLEALTVADAQIDAFFRARNINVTWTLESIHANGTTLAAPTQAAGALATFEDEVNFALYPEGKFLFLDGGTLDLGVVRDGTMVAANEYSTFVETFEAVAAVSGAESLWVTASGVTPSGAAADLVTLSLSGVSS